MKIVLAGYIVGYPLGGMTWHHLNYLLGLRSLGHEVTYLEDGAYLPPFDPSTGDSGNPAYGVEYLRQTLAKYGLDNTPWHYRFGEFSAGLGVEEICRRLREADLLICVSGVTPLDWYPRPRRSLVIDTDPVFTQLRMARDEAFLAYYRSFTTVATFGRLIGTPASPLPTHGLRWIPTNQPISLAHWPALPNPSRAFTTIGKWEHSAARDVAFQGKTFASSKSAEWMKLLWLPLSAPSGFRLAMAVERMPDDVRQTFESAGWRLDDAHAVSRDPATFRIYIADSAGELTVAKQIYAGLPSGWFSDRSACYLATGRPVVTQSSGFEQWLPIGEGLFCFKTLDEAAEALRRVGASPDEHRRYCRAARRIAETYFDAEKVLTELLSAAA